MAIRPILVFLCAVALWPRIGSAQIYAWRDEAGTLVLSDRRGAPNADTYDVPGAAGVRTTRPTAVRSAHEPFEPLIHEHAIRAGLRPDLVRAVIQVESGFNPRATSPKGAMGLMQLMPGTAKELGVVNPYDPADNIRGGTTYLRQLLDRYDGDETLALAAYNAGFNAVDRYGGRVPPFQETQNYVKRIGAVARVEATTGPARAGQVIYKTVEIVDGRPVIRYSNARPDDGGSQVVAR